MIRVIVCIYCFIRFLRGQLISSACPFSILIYSRNQYIPVFSIILRMLCYIKKAKAPFWRLCFNLSMFFHFLFYIIKHFMRRFIFTCLYSRSS